MFKKIFANLKVYTNKVSLFLFTLFVCRLTYAEGNEEANSLVKLSKIYDGNMNGQTTVTGKLVKLAEENQDMIYVSAGFFILMAIYALLFAFHESAIRTAIRILGGLFVVSILSAIILNIN